MADPVEAGEHIAEALPDHWSWFSLIPDSMSEWAGETFDLCNSAGETWIFGGQCVEHERWFFGGHISMLHVWALIAVVLLLTLFGLLTKAAIGEPKEAIVPSDKLTIANFMELMTLGVYGMMAGMMGKKAAKYFLPLIGTCAFVILISNVMGLVPGFLPPTDTLTTTAGTAGVIFLATHYYGIKTNGFAYIKHMMGPAFKLGGMEVPLLAPLILPIEIVSHLVRPLTLCVRLTANMFADHIVLTVFLTLLTGSLALASSVIAIPVYILGCLVVTIQTLVFCLLSTVYISMAIEPLDEHH